MGLFSGLTGHGLLDVIGRLARHGGRPFAPTGRGAGHEDEHMLGRAGLAMDPQRLAMARAVLAGDLGAVSRIVEPLRQRRLAARTEGSKNRSLDKGMDATDGGPISGVEERLYGSLEGGAAGHSAVSSPTAFQSHTLPWPDSPVFRGQSDLSERGEEVGENIVDLAENPAARPPAEVRAETARTQAVLREKGLNGWGYSSRGSEDVHDLARIMYAEAFDVPEDMPAVGWVVLNRTNRPGYRPTITDVIHQRGQFEPVREGNGRGIDSRHWIRFDQPHLLTREELERRKQAFGFAEAILSGRQFDLTRGATHMQAPYADSPWFARAVREGRLEPLPYRSKGTHPHRHLFYREADPPKDR